MKPRILLVNPPIYDFSAYDIWLKPYGLLRVAGFLRNQAEFHLVDFLDRLDSRIPAGNYRSDRWAAARFSEPLQNPAAPIRRMSMHISSSAIQMLKTKLSRIPCTSPIASG